MWYTVESDKSTIRNEGTTSCKVTYQNLSKLFHLPLFKALTVGLEGDLSGLTAWAEGMPGKMKPFTLEKAKRVKLDLLSKADAVVVGNVWYDASKTIFATFNRTRDAIDILGMFYPHWLISYGQLNSEYRRMSIREIIEKL